MFILKVCFLGTLGELNNPHNLPPSVLTVMKTVKISSLYCQTTTWLDQQARHFNDEQDEYHNGYDERDGVENFAIQLWQTMINLYINSINL